MLSKPYPSVSTPARLLFICLYIIEIRFIPFLPVGFQYQKHVETYEKPVEYEQTLKTVYSKEKDEKQIPVP